MFKKRVLSAPATNDVYFPSGQPSVSGQYEEGSFPIQRPPWKALMAWFWRLEPDLMEMRPKASLAERAATGDATAELAKRATMKVLENILIVVDWYYFKSIE